MELLGIKSRRTAGLALTSQKEKGKGSWTGSHPAPSSHTHQSSHSHSDKNLDTIRISSHPPSLPSSPSLLLLPRPFLPAFPVSSTAPPTDQNTSKQGALPRFQGEPHHHCFSLSVCSEHRAQQAGADRHHVHGAGDGRWRRLGRASAQGPDQLHPAPHSRRPLRLPALPLPPPAPPRAPPRPPPVPPPGLPPSQRWHQQRKHLAAILRADRRPARRAAAVPRPHRRAARGGPCPSRRCRRAREVPRWRGAVRGRHPRGARGGGGQVVPQHGVPRRDALRGGGGAAPVRAPRVRRRPRGGYRCGAADRRREPPEPRAAPRGLRRAQGGEAARAPLLRRRLAPPLLARGNRRLAEVEHNLQAFSLHRQGAGSPAYGAGEADHPRQPQDEQHPARRWPRVQDIGLRALPPAEHRRRPRDARDIRGAGVQGARAGQDEGRHQGERRVQLRGGSARDARAEGVAGEQQQRQHAQLPRHLPAGLLQESRPREEDLRRVQLGPRQAEQEGRE